MTFRANEANGGLGMVTFLPREHLRVCYWDAENSLLDATKIVLEERLRQLGEVTMVRLNSLEDKAFHPCDLLITTAQHVPDEEFLKWLKALNQRIAAQEMIWTPALIFSKTRFGPLADSLKHFVKTNWYFDIVSVEHIESLPIRVANLLRIHDHLHELRRYQEQVDDLARKVSDLEESLTP